MKSIWLKCYRCEFMAPKKYRCEFMFQDKIPVELELPAPAVPGTDYELLIKGIWGDFETRQMCLSEIISFTCKDATLNIKE